MLWHVVKFRFRAEVSEAERAEFAEMLRGLAGAVETLKVIRVAPAIDEPDVLGLITGFTDARGLEAYKVHPQHLPVIERAKALTAETTRLDIETADPPDALPLSG